MKLFEGPVSVVLASELKYTLNFRQSCGWPPLPANAKYKKRGLIKIKKKYFEDPWNVPEELR